jgi:hypothetical protein
VAALGCLSKSFERGRVVRRGATTFFDRVVFFSAPRMEPFDAHRLAGRLDGHNLDSPDCQDRLHHKLYAQFTDALVCSAAINE